MSILISFSAQPTLCVDLSHRNSISVNEVKQIVQQHTAIPEHEQRLQHGRSHLHSNSVLSLSSSFPLLLSCHLSLCGGKGGFGSLLRAATTKVGAKKTSNFSSSRDLNGRRLRHVETEEKIAQWNAEEHKFNPNEIKQKYKDIKDGKHTDVKPCKWGLECKYKYKCRLSHPDDDIPAIDIEKEASSKMSRHFDEQSTEVVTEDDMLQAIAMGLQQKRKHTDTDTDTTAEEQKEQPHIHIETNNQHHDKKRTRLNDHSEPATDAPQPVSSSSSSSSSASPSVSLSSSCAPVSLVSVSSPVPVPVCLPSVSPSFPPLSISSIVSEISLVSLPCEQLINACQLNGLKSGGTQEQRAQRLWALKTQGIEKIPKKYKAQTK